MNARLLRLFAILILSVVAFEGWAQNGPNVPCTNCESRLSSTYPDSGPWVNTDTTGSGFLLQVQNGILAGFYFGYTTEGQPEWLIFSGALVPGETGSSVQWEIEASLSRFSGGSCFACEYAAPTSQDSVGTIKLEFYQRNHGRFQFNDEQAQFMVPLLYGSPGRAHFEEHTSYLVPDLASDPVNPTAWVMFFYEGPPLEQNLANSVIVHFPPANVTMTEESGKVIEYESLESLSLADPEPPVARIKCFDTLETGDIECEIRVAILSFGKLFRMPIANMGASRFFGEDENGDTIEGIRLFYD